MNPVKRILKFEELQEFLTDPASRIVDSRMLESFDDFAFTLQVLHTDNSISQVEARPTFTETPDGMKIENTDQWRKDSLELFRLQYRNSPRMNPALYGLLDAADAESRVENTQPIQSR